MLKVFTSKKLVNPTIFGGICTIIGAVIGALGSIAVPFITEKLGNSEQKSNVNGSVVEVGQGAIIEQSFSSSETLINKETNNSYENNHYYNIQENIDSYSIDTILLLASTALENGNYEEAMKLYLIEKLKDNDMALYNIGYMYLNGLYVEQDFNKAKYYFQKVNSSDGLIGLLATAIWEENTSDIGILVNQLAAENNYDFWNYLSFCEYGKSIDEIRNENITIEEYSIDNFYQYSYTDNTYRGYNPPGDTFQSRWLPIGVDFDDSTPYTIYRMQRLLYFDMINKPKKI